MIMMLNVVIFMIMINEVSIDIASKGTDHLLLVSKIHHEFKVHWNFLKGKGGFSSQVHSSLGILKRWLLVAGSR